MPVAVSLVLRVPTPVLEHHSAASPELVGYELAEQVNGYAWAHRLRYYPAIGYFMDQGGIDGNLLDACRNIAWLAKELVQEEVHRRLRGVFHGVEIASIRSTAFLMPRVRPSMPNAVKRLAGHYTANAVRTTLVLTAPEPPAADHASEAYARRMLWRWLKDHFSAMEVTSTQVVSGTGSC